jgi:hypothetical protein
MAAALEQDPEYDLHRALPPHPRGGEHFQRSIPSDPSITPLPPSKSERSTQ